jgi:hypothetical protein
VHQHRHARAQQHRPVGGVGLWRWQRPTALLAAQRLAGLCQPEGIGRGVGHC